MEESIQAPVLEQLPTDGTATNVESEASPALQAKEAKAGSSRDEISADLSPLNYANRLAENLGLPATSQNLKVIAAAVEALVKTGKSKPAAYEFLLARAKDAQQNGVEVNKFWFEDARYNATNTTPRKHDEKVVLFYTCTVNYNDPDIGKAAVAVFEKNGIECVVPKQQCCGLPFVDQSMLDPFMEKVKANVATLSAYVKKGYKIIAPSASCSYMLKHDYPDYLRTDDCKLVAQNTYDLSEYLIMLHEQKKLDLDFTEQVGQVRYHQPCHLMAQNIGFKAQELLKLIPGADVRRLQACSGHDGSWSVKKEYFEESMKVGRPLFNFMKAGGENCQCTSDCPLSAIQIKQGTGMNVVHPIQILARAYGLKVGK